MSSSQPATASDLGLRCETPTSWAAQACCDLPQLLDDHAHLERKAASNALALLHRWPVQVRSVPAARRDWVRTLASIATEEAQHLGQVLTELERVGGVFSAGHTNTYAVSLREHVRRGGGRRELLDRLLISGLIEARSCERFRLLGEGAPEERLRRFYARLARSEAGHHHAFQRLAGHVVSDDVRVRRLQELAEIEARVIVAQPAGPHIHGWVDPDA